jgi:hypothetical protein
MYHPEFQAVDSVGAEMETFDYEETAVAFWVGAPTGVDIQRWTGNEWEEYDPSSFSAD